MFHKIGICLLLCIACSQVLLGNAIYSYMDIHHPVIGSHGMVATQEKHASEIGLDILKKGGNAVDAAVAVGFALSVTLPRAGNLGGGGFMLLHLASPNTTIALDYREVAPLSAHRELFLDKEGNPSANLSRKSILSTGIPGTVAGLITALETYGSLPLETVIQPAIELAENGFEMSSDLIQSLERAKPEMKKHAETFNTFFKPDGSSYQRGDILKQPNLARSLKRISQYGKNGFYSGYIADQLIDYAQKEGGSITKEDLTQYTPVFRKPVEGAFHNYRVVSMPPPSSGGIHLLQLLHFLERYPLSNWGHNSAESIHIMAETMKLAYADRSQYLGDPDFSYVPVDELLNPEYLAERQAIISTKNITPSTEIFPGTPRKYPYESNETTHFSIVDQWGNCVSNTYTLNFSYGNKRMIPGTGILLNNEMDDFSSKPGEPNAYGLIGGEKNAIEPQKRMLSSMTPTIVFSDGKPFLITGSPGGSRIITTVLQIILNVTEFDLSIAEATHAPRIHHQWFPDELRLEKGISIDTQRLLEQKGHILTTTWGMGSTQSILIDNGILFGSSDPRKPGALTIGY